MYDFDHAPDRRATNSVKWAVHPGELPMWIADMDFRTAPAILTAMQKKISLGAFGYEAPGPDYFAAVATWYSEMHHTKPAPDWMLFATGVIPALSAIVRRITQVGDNVLVQAPVYDIFYHSIENNGRHVLSSDLCYQDGHYHIDWADLEAKLAAPLTTMMILCNPHNPIGKVWSQAELEQIATLCLRHHVVLVADEIHGDLVWQGPDYTPVFSLPAPLHNNTISLVSPSKTFNVAALHAATVIVPDPALRAQVNRGLNTDEVAEPNLLAIPGTIAAYTQGAGWLRALRRQLAANAEQAKRFIAANLPEVKVIESSATYLMWLDVQAISTNAEKLASALRASTGLIVSAGSVYRGDGTHFLRLNFACPPAMLADGLNRLAKGIKLYEHA
ncbi:MalY/PatB family protein [Lacticaseibacillus salsurivasis]|uniref:MalY/PatB family protein n=1 Tax=Lacticaseibacillus salsurivasis TaxID=3081441 RepID=UPI0030C6C938